MQGRRRRSDGRNDTSWSVFAEVSDSRFRRRLLFPRSDAATDGNEAIGARKPGGLSSQFVVFSVWDSPTHTNMDNQCGDDKMTSKKIIWALITAAIISVLPNLTRAQHRAPVLDSSRVLAAERQNATTDISDPAFDVYVNPATIGRAYAGIDAVLLTDVALQLAEGERILLRARKGITAKQGLQLALKAASSKQDTASLERLSRFASLNNDQDLANQIASAQKLAAVSRDTTQQMTVPIDDVGVEEYRRIRFCLRAIDQAKLTGDVRCLQALESDIPTYIPDRFRQNIIRLVADARSGMPKTEIANEQFISVLSRLAQASRQDGAFVGPPEPVPEPPRRDYDDSPPLAPQNQSGSF